MRLNVNRKKNLDFSAVTDNVTLTIHNAITARREKSDSWLDAVSTYCEDNEVDIEDMVGLLSDSIKDKLYKEGIENRTLIATEPSLPL